MVRALAGSGPDLKPTAEGGEPIGPCKSPVPMAFEADAELGSQLWGHSGNWLATFIADAADCQRKM